MDSGTIMLWAFFGSWAGWTFMGFKKKQSAIVAIGGGLLFSIVFLIVTIQIIKQFPGTLPDSFKQAGLSGKKWNKDEVTLAAKITVASLSQIDSVVADADRVGDARAAASQIDAVLEIIEGWNDQDGNPEVSGFRNCTLATVHVMDGVSSVMQGGRYLTRSRFEAALDGCESAI